VPLPRRETADMTPTPIQDDFDARRLAHPIG
jgi:hypothetical protein